MHFLTKQKTGATPTVDKYFRVAMADLIRPQRLWRRLPGHHARPVRQLGPHLFATEAAAVLVRHCTKYELQTLEKLRPEKCFYVIDDDLPAIVQDSALPPDYRRRTQAFMEDMLPRILRLCHAVVAPTPEILRHYAATHETCLLEPAAVHIRDDFRHFDTAENFTIVFMGTRAHLADLNMIAPALADFCRDHPDARLMTFLGRHAPRQLRNLPNIKHLRPRRWPAFHRLIMRKAWHAALAPMRDTQVNRARSFNKLLDHAAVGAAGLYSAESCPAITRVVRHGEHGLLVDNSPEAWRAALEEIHRNRTLAQRLARNAARLAGELGSSVRCRRFWLQRLCPDTSLHLPS